MPRQSRFLIIWQNRINFSLCQPRILHTVLKQTQQKKGYIHPVLLRYRTLLFEYHLRSDHNYEIGNESLFLPLQTAVSDIPSSDWKNIRFHASAHDLCLWSRNPPKYHYLPLLWCQSYPQKLKETALSVRIFPLPVVVSVFANRHLLFLS